MGLWAQGKQSIEIYCKNIFELKIHIKYIPKPKVCMIREMSVGWSSNTIRYLISSVVKIILTGIKTCLKNN